MRSPAHRRARLLAAPLVGFALLVGACGGGADEDSLVSGEGDIEPVPVEELPLEIGGLTVAPENVADGVSTVVRSYLRQVGLFSLRDGELLQGTLQVSRFDADVDPDDEEFRRTLVQQIGGTEPRLARVGDDTVYLTTSTSQRIAVWFRDDAMLILATRDEYKTPRTLLRQALEVEV